MILCSRGKETRKATGGVTLYMYHVWKKKNKRRLYPDLAHHVSVSCLLRLSQCVHVYPPFPSEMAFQFGVGRRGCHFLLALGVSLFLIPKYKAYIMHVLHMWYDLMESRSYTDYHIFLYIQMLLRKRKCSLGLYIAFSNCSLIIRQTPFWLKEFTYESDCLTSLN